MVRFGTTNRSPSTEASRPSPLYSTIGTRPREEVRRLLATRYSTVRPFLSLSGSRRRRVPAPGGAVKRRPERHPSRRRG
jgi:hypothetical protein